MTTTPDTRCRYVKINGARCTSPVQAGGHHDLCVEHTFRKLYTRGKLRPNPPSTYNTVPLVRFAWADDHDAVLFNCNQIALALVHSLIDARQAGTLNALMHTCQRSLRQKFLHERFEARERERAAAQSTGTPAAPPVPDTVPDTVSDFVLDTDGMPLAVLPSAVPEPAVQEPAVADAAAPAPEPPVPDPADAPQRPDYFAEFERTPEQRITDRREAIAFLLDYYKDDPKMLAELQADPDARYATQPNPAAAEPAVPEPGALCLLTASADPNPFSINQLPATPVIATLPSQRPPATPLFPTLSKKQGLSFTGHGTGRPTLRALSS